jgi:hypothetical protein
VEDIEGFLGRLDSCAYIQGWGWDGDLHDERSFGDESWADEMDELFKRAEAAFLEGGLTLARAAFGLLLKSFERHAEGFCGPEKPEEMLNTDVGEAKARYLRAVYETTPLTDRPEPTGPRISRLCERRWLDELVQEAARGADRDVPVDAYGDAEQLGPFARVLDELLAKSVAVSVVGEPVELSELDLTVAAYRKWTKGLG